MDYCLGIDTSNYTTSLAAVPVEKGEVVFVRRLLATPKGAVGLRQSDAHFQHTKNLPLLAEELQKKLPDGARFTAVSVSARPRPVEGSYMPCFLAGVAAAHTAALSASLPVYETSHQEGHIAAALYGCPAFPDVPRFYSLHLSGGTMELLLVEKKPGGYAIELVLKTLDVTAGQLIDRVGVMLSLPFPCGRELDALALSYTGKQEKMALSVKGDGINLSGLQNRAEAMYKNGESAEKIAHFLFSHLARAIGEMHRALPEKLPLLLCGGVSASAFLKRSLTEDDYYFTDPALSTDNAVGVALLGLERGGRA